MQRLNFIFGIRFWEVQGRNWAKTGYRRNYWKHLEKIYLRRFHCLRGRRICCNFQFFRVFLFSFFGSKDVVSIAMRLSRDPTIVNYRAFAGQLESC